MTIVTKWTVAALSWLLVALASAPARAEAQPPPLIPAGKALEYRLIDTDTGAELRRDTTWLAGDSASRSRWTRTVFPNGDWALAQCVEGHGAGKPATMRLEVTVNPSGRIVQSDFDTFDPNYYPFLHRPLPAQPMESAPCFTANGIDYAALQRGEDTSLYMWLSEAAYVRLIFRMAGRESVSVPAGSFDAIKVRVRLDMATFFPNLPGWAADTLGVLAPDIYAWVITNDKGEFVMVRQTGFEVGKHKRTMQELVGVSNPPAVSQYELDRLHEASAVPIEPQTVVDDTGTFTVGDLSGRVTLGAAKDGAADLLAVRTQFEDGLVIEGRSLVNPDASPRTSYVEQRTYAPNRSLVLRRYLAFRADAFPMEPDKDLPSDLYASSFTLAEVFPKLRPQSDGESRFHVLGFNGEVNQLAMWQAGGGPSPSGGESALHMKLKPIVDLPFYLQPLKYFLLPTLDAYMQDAPPYRLLEFNGPLGLPGSAPAHFVADPRLQAPPQAQLQAAPVDSQPPGK